MSLLLDALHRASKDKEKAALAAAHAAAAESLSEGKFGLTAPTVPAADFPDLVPSAIVITSPIAETPMELATEPSTAMAKPEVLELEMELEVSPPPAVVPQPEKPAEKAFLVDRAPVKGDFSAAESAVASAVVTAPIKRTDSSPKSPNPQAAAAAIQNAYAAPVFATRRPPERRAMVLAGIAAALGLAFASFALGLWGDPEKLLGLSSVSSVAPPAAMQQAPAAVPPPLVAVVPDGNAVANTNTTAPSTVSAPSMAPAPVASTAAPLLQGPASATMPAVAIAPPPAPSPKDPPNPQINEPVLRATPAGPVFAARARSQSALEVAYAALQAGRFEDASRAYAAALDANPGEPDALLGLAYIAHSKGQRDEAQSYYRRVLRQEPGNSVANAGLVALDAGANGTFQGERVKELAARQPESAAVQALAARALVQEGALPDAALAFARAQALEPTNPLHAYNLAVALDKLGDYAQAASQYEKALRINAAAAAPLGAPQASAARLRAAQLRQALGLSPEAAP